LQNVGGLAGISLANAVIGSWATGAVSGQSFVGGLIGLKGSGSTDTSFATGNVAGTTDATGGLIGQNTGPVTKSYAKTGTVTGARWVGGLIGYNQGTIATSYATNNVTGTTYVGGLAGISFTPGNGITDCYAKGQVTGSDAVGGLIGRYETASGSNLARCYASGTIVVTGAVVTPAIGGFIGDNQHPNNFNNYWNSQTAAYPASGAGFTAGATGLTTAQTLQQASFVGFVFPSPWLINEGVTTPYLDGLLVLPTVTTGAASSITGNGATLNGTVSSNGAGTTVTFEYGLTTGYGSTVTADQSPLAASAVGVAVSKAVTGLACGKTYNFRVVASNSVSGPVNGNNATFPTAACNVDLSSLTLSAGTLLPSFASATQNYSAGVASIANTVTVTPTVADATSTVKVNNVTVASGSPSGPITLSAGANPPISIVVTGADGVSTKPYTVTVTYTPLSSCTYSLSPLDLSSLAKAGGTFNVTVTTPAGCPVTADSFFQPWVNVNSITLNGATTTVALQIGVNAGPARGTAIRVADRLYLITQQAGP
jgi:hypothetical protein